MRHAISAAGYVNSQVPGSRICTPDEGINDLILGTKPFELKGGSLWVQRHILHIDPNCLVAIGNHLTVTRITPKGPEVLCRIAPLNDENESESYLPPNIIPVLTNFAQISSVSIVCAVYLDHPYEILAAVVGHTTMAADLISFLFPGP